MPLVQYVCTEFVYTMEVCFSTGIYPLEVSALAVSWNVHAVVLHEQVIMTHAGAVLSFDGPA